MIYQCNLLITIALVPLCLVFLVNYVRVNSGNIFFWVDQRCGGGATGGRCLEAYLQGPVNAVSAEFLDLLRTDYLEPPPDVYNSDDFSIYTPVWRKLVDWYEVQEQLQEVWADQPPGYFLEVGAVDGEFMSQTIYLERNLSWTGLLIEPDPRSYALLRSLKRNAWTSPMCVHLDFPTLDDERGTTIWVMCAPLTPLLVAANITRVDLLSIATGHDRDEDRIQDVLLSKKIDVKTLLIQYPTSRFYETPYPAIRGYIMDMAHSQLLIKFYVKESHCVLVQRGQCKAMKYYDTLQACEQYFCLGHLTVWTHYKNATRIE